jgi:hypothetical protein
MTAETTPPAAADSSPDDGRRLTNEQLGELLAVLKGVDSVELKVSVPTEKHVATIRGLPLDPVEAQPRQVFFFDTPSLDLNAAGVVVRARRIQGGRGDTVVKLRPVQPSQLSPELRRNASFNVEVDVLPGGFVCSASFKGRTTGQEVRDTVAGGLPLHGLFSKDQRAFYGEHAPNGLELDSLVTLGPTYILKNAFTIPEGADAPTVLRRLVAELWLYPDGSRILELSTKCAPTQAFQVAAETRAYLGAMGIALGGTQQTKTRAALDFFSSQLNANEALPTA